MQPKVSVIMPCRNSAAFLRNSITCILQQTLSDLELVIVNDGSTDSSVAILNELEGCDDRIKVIHISPSGLTHALQIGLQHCRADFIARHDSDDLSHPERLKAQYNYLRTHTGHGLLGTGIALINVDGEQVGKPRVIKGDRLLRLLLKTGNCFVHGSVMFRKDLARSVGGYRSAFRFSQDYDLWCRIAMRSKIHTLPARLYLLRLHPESISSVNWELQRQYAALAAGFFRQR